MRQNTTLAKKLTWLAFFGVFALSLTFVLAFGGGLDAAQAAPAPEAHEQGLPGYKGSATCAGCHKDTHTTWSGTLHAQAYSSPIFQEDRVKQGSAVSCLECHATGYDTETGTYFEEGVGCESCHGPLAEGHPDNPMPVTPDATLCATCHKTTTDEWRASKHGQVGLDCQTCHDPHSQTPRANSINELCSSCHKDTSSSFTHGTHSEAGLQCSDCHMARAQPASFTGGLFATGHTFAVGSEACISCHRDTVHTRDTIARLSDGEAGQATIEELQKTAQENAQKIQSLEAQGTVRLYTGLIQGAIVGVITGGVAAWVVSKRIRYVDDEEEKEKPEGEQHGS